MSVEPAPPSATNGRPGQSPSAPDAAQRTVLLADDDDAVREFVRAVLEQAGFVVVATSDGQTASELFAENPARFVLLVTDVIMPHVIGPELVARARQLRPDLPVLFMSAFPGGPGVAPDPVPANEALLEKPFTVASLLKAVGEILGRK